MRLLMMRMLSGLGMTPMEVASAEESLALVKDDATLDVVLSDVMMPGLNGLDLLRMLREQRPELPVVMMSASSEVSNAVQARRRGAFDYLLKPISPQELARVLRNAVHQARLQRALDAARSLREADVPAGLVVASAAMREVVGRARLVADSRAPVLLHGPSGSGKEHVARLIHDAGRRAEGPFVPVNCATLVENLAEAELFDHARGAYTGANGARVGLVEQANGGTLFLDEVGELSLEIQAKLLRFLQEGIVRSVMGLDRQVDVRVVAASWRDLEVEAAEGRFRYDLLYRFDVARLTLPSLEEQREAILPSLSTCSAASRATSAARRRS